MQTTKAHQSTGRAGAKSFTGILMPQGADGAFLNTNAKVVVVPQEGELWTEGKDPKPGRVLLFYGALRFHQVGEVAADELLEKDFILPGKAALGRKPKHVLESLCAGTGSHGISRSGLLQEGGEERWKRRAREKLSSSAGVNWKTRQKQQQHPTGEEAGVEEVITSHDMP